MTTDTFSLDNSASEIPISSNDSSRINIVEDAVLIKEPPSVVEETLDTFAGKLSSSPQTISYHDFSDSEKGGGKIRGY